MPAKKAEALVPKAAKTPVFKPVTVLRKFMRRNGCFRLPNQDRLAEGHRKYKKGYEARLVANSKTELVLMRKFLKQLKVKPGTSYQKTVARQKSPRYVLPIYGKDVVLQFAALVKVQL